MKVIDLLNEMVKGTQPKHIRVFKQDWYWNNYDGYVKRESLSITPDAQCYLFNQYRLDFALDKTVEIIEDTPNYIFKHYSYKEDKKIEKLNMSETHYMIDHTEIMEKINEIIERLNGEDNVKD